MSKATVNTLAQLIAVTAISSARLNEYYNEALVELAGTTEVNIQVETTPIVSGTDKYTYNSIAGNADMVQVLTVFNDDGFELLQTNLTQLDSQGRAWRTDTGSPTAWFLQHEQERQVRLYPIPDANGTMTLFVKDKEDAVPAWLDLPLAFAILKREFMRSSAQHDPVMVELCEQAGAIFRGIGGSP